jgi:Spy/CpxP family protein refolding chaperone
MHGVSDLVHKERLRQELLQLFWIRCVSPETCFRRAPEFDQKPIQQYSTSKEETMKYLLAVTLSAVMAIPAFTQTTPTPPTPSEMAKHQVKLLTTLLSLSSTQQQQATTIYTNAATAEQAALGNGKALHESLRSAIKNNDATAIDQVSSTMGQSAAQLTSIKAKADAAFYQILTPEQQGKVSELESQHMLPFAESGGPGGPPAMGFR